MRNTLSENIKSLRLQNGMNQVDFAKKMCVTKQCVSNWDTAGEVQIVSGPLCSLPVC